MCGFVSAFRDLLLHAETESPLKRVRLLPAPKPHPVGQPSAEVSVIVETFNDDNDVDDEWGSIAVWMLSLMICGNNCSGGHSLLLLAMMMMMMAVLLTTQEIDEAELV